MVEWRDIARPGRVGVPRGTNLANEIDTDDVHGNGPGDSITPNTGAYSDWIDPKYDPAGNMIDAPLPARGLGGSGDTIQWP